MGISVNACYEDEKGPLVGPFSFAFAVEPVRGVFCTLIPLYVMDGMSKNATHEPGVDALVRSIMHRTPVSMCMRQNFVTLNPELPSDGVAIVA